jgi:hypothetical protein
MLTMIDEATNPKMKLILPRLADAELGELVGWTAGLETRHGCAAPRFCLWLAESVVAELKRRTSGGEVEAGSIALPAMGPREVGIALIVLSGRTYAPQGIQVAAFFDECLRHVTALAAVQLSEFENLCNEINRQQNGSEADDN